MADRVRYNMDRLAGLFRQYEEADLFTSQEVKSVVKKRTDFEYTMMRMELTQNEVNQYLRYEEQLDQLLELRIKKKLSIYQDKTFLRIIQEIRTKTIQHVHYIYQRVCKRFSQDITLYQQAIRYLQGKEANHLLDNLLGQAIASHPKEVTFYLLAAKHELSVHRNLYAARVLLQQGLRNFGYFTSMKSSKMKLSTPLGNGQAIIALWGEYLDLEIWQLLRRLARQDYLLGDNNKTRKEVVKKAEKLEGEEEEEKEEDHMDVAITTQGNEGEVEVEKMIATLPTSTQGKEEGGAAGESELEGPLLVILRYALEALLKPLSSGVTPEEVRVVLAIFSQWQQRLATLGADIVPQSLAYTREWSTTHLLPLLLLKEEGEQAEVVKMGYLQLWTINEVSIFAVDYLTSHYNRIQQDSGSSSGSVNFGGDAWSKLLVAWESYQSKWIASLLLPLSDSKDSTYLTTFLRWSIAYYFHLLAKETHWVVTQSNSSEEVEGSSGSEENGSVTITLEHFQKAWLHVHSYYLSNHLLLDRVVLSMAPPTATKSKRGGGGKKKAVESSGTTPSFDMVTVEWVEHTFLSQIVHSLFSSWTTTTTENEKQQVVGGVNSSYYYIAFSSFVELLVDHFPNQLTLSYQDILANRVDLLAGLVRHSSTFIHHLLSSSTSTSSSNDVVVGSLQSKVFDVSTVIPRLHRLLRITYENVGGVGGGGGVVGWRDSLASFLLSLLHYLLTNNTSSVTTSSVNTVEEVVQEVMWKVFTIYPHILGSIDRAPLYRLLLDSLLDDSSSTTTTNKKKFPIEDVLRRAVQDCPNASDLQDRLVHWLREKGMHQEANHLHYLKRRRIHA
eukprot:gene10962-12188_t